MQNTKSEKDALVGPHLNHVLRLLQPGENGKDALEDKKLCERNAR